MGFNTRTCKEIYTQLESKKSQVMRRAEQAAEYTIPAIFPKEHHMESNALPVPNQSLGAKACNNLQAKMLLALFPPNTSFFRLDAGLDPETAEEKDLVDEINEALAETEKGVASHLESTTLRSTMSNKLLLEIITGNSALDIDNEAAMRVFSVRDYVVERDPSGTVIDFVLKEMITPRKIGEEDLAIYFSDSEIEEFLADPEAEIELYTRMYMVEGKYKVYQEINGTKVPDSDGTYPMDAPKFIITRWRAVDGEEYGRGLVEEMLGDFAAYDGFCLDLKLASKQAAKVIFTVSPNGFITPEELEKADSGDVLEGDAEDVKTIRIDKNGDFNITYQTVTKLERSLSESFLMHSSVQRNAERVTAEEIRYMAQELEDALGGVYSVYGQEVQRPMLNRLLNILTKQQKIPVIPKGINIKITTGLDALGRSHETNKLIGVIRAAKEVLGEDAVAERIKADAVITALGGGSGVDIDQFLYSDEEVAQRNQARMQQSIIESSVPGAIQQAVGAAANQTQQ